MKAPDPEIEEWLTILHRAKNNLAKNNLALGASRTSIEVFWLGPPAAQTGRNTFADAKVLIFQGAASSMK